MSYGFNKEINKDFDSAVERVKVSLKSEGFGILTEIDVKQTLKEKIDVDFKKYKILGACNPPLAHKALEAEEEIGLLLPCNVIVYESNEKTIVSMINPIEAMSIVNNDSQTEIAMEVKDKLKKVLDRL